MARDIKGTGTPLSVQDRLKDMQSLLIMKSIRAAHDSDPTVLGAIDHAIGILQKRVDKNIEQAADDPRKQLLREGLARVERGDAFIREVGARRECEQISIGSLADSSMRSMPGRISLIYSFEIETTELLEQ